MKGTSEASPGVTWRAAGALCVLTMIIFGVLAGQHYLAPSESDKMATGVPAAAAAAEVSTPCGSCDARHRHILRLREAAP
jgi:hypothetical protein